MTTLTIDALHIYPVKGLGGISQRHATTTSRGLQHDRRFMVVDAALEFVSQREVPKMATVWTEIVESTLELAAADMPTVSLPLSPAPQPTRAVRVWSSSVQAQAVSAEVDAWLTEYLGFDARLVYMPETSERRCNPEYARHGEIVSFADGYPVLIANTASLDDLNRRIALNGGAPVPMNRFRPNIVVSGASPWAEDTWHTLHSGAVTMRAVKPCARCQVTTTDQASGEVRGPEPLQTLSSFRDSAKGIMFGVNLTIAAHGVLAVGDSLNVE
jgi:uncharacterized protein YcbX